MNTAPQDRRWAFSERRARNADARRTPARASARGRAARSLPALLPFPFPVLFPFPFPVLFPFPFPVLFPFPFPVL
ncbi:hypothetical protein AB0N21_10505, partial [Streptomyces sp. NPDC051080]|uniref:hypothetical protein n=1 Tax=Streptomyces sp. NPDC051080 TaxID=3157222 RepID=UPI00343F75CD